MSESFVDLTYRGLQLGRRIKLTQIRPSTGHLELPAPMPVGTAIAIATEEGVRIDAVVTQVYEQVGGAERTVGMTVAPALADAAASTWWQARIALPEAEASPASASASTDAAPRSVVVLPRSRTPSSAPPVGAAAESAPAPAAPAAAESPAAAAAPAAPAAADSPAAEPAASDELASSESDAPLVDDGKKTIMMQSVDLSALGLEAGASGQFATRDIEAAADEGDDGDGAEADAAAATGGGGEPLQPVVPVVPVQQGAAGKKRKKRR